MNKKFTLEEIVKAAEVHLNDDCTCNDCPIKDDFSCCLDNFVRAFLLEHNDNKQFENENTQQRHTIERLRESFREANNLLVLEQAKNECLTKRRNKRAMRHFDR